MASRFLTTNRKDYPMSKTISILGVEVEISTPYAEGHTITAAEAKALNQTRAENIGNNFRKRIKDSKEGVEGAEPMEKILADLAAYDASYVFTLAAATLAAAGGSRSTMTPLEKESNRVAKQWLVAKLKEAGSSLKKYTEEHGADYVKAKVAEVAATDAIQAQAKKNLAAAQKTADAVGIGL